MTELQLDSNGEIEIGEVENAVFEGSYRIRSKFCGDDGNGTYVQTSGRRA